MFQGLSPHGHELLLIPPQPATAARTAQSADGHLHVKVTGLTRSNSPGIRLGTNSASSDASRCTVWPSEQTLPPRFNLILFFGIP